MKSSSLKKTKKAGRTIHASPPFNKGGTGGIFGAKQQLNELQIDMLREIANIGACHAANALSQLVQKRIMIHVPRISKFSLSDLSDIFNGPETLVAGLYAPVSGEISGNMLFLLSSKDAFTIVDLLWGRPMGETKALTERDRELLRQASNILIASYLMAMTKFTGMTSSAAPAAVAFDMLGAVFDAIAVEVNARTENAVLVETNILETADKVNGLLFFMPDVDCLDKTLQKMRVES